VRILTALLAMVAVITAIPAWFADDEPVDIRNTAQDRYFGVEVTDEDELFDLFDRIGSLRVATWNEELKEPELIEVSKQNETWVISSHQDYPADGQSMVAKTAAQVIGVEKLVPVADQAARHQELGVLDPLDRALTAVEGRGRRVTVRDGQGGELADVIVGKAVEGRRGQYYVREADDQSVFTAQVVPERDDQEASAGFERVRFLNLSTRFIDWVKPNPFSLDGEDIVELLILDYSFDEVEGRPEIRAQTQLHRAEADADWTTERTPRGRVVDQDEIDAIVKTAASLRLAGVDQRGGLPQLELAQRGFYVMQDVGLVANEGTLHLQSDDGLRYMLYFGEISSTVTSQREAGGSAPSGDVGENDRYLAVFVNYVDEQDAELPQLEEFIAEEQARLEKELEEAEAAATGDEGGSEAAEEEAQAEESDDGIDAYARKKAEAAWKKARNEHIEKRKEKAQELNQRYSEFFYIIRDSDFQDLRPDTDRLFTEPSDEDEQDGE